MCNSGARKQIAPTDFIEGNECISGSSCVCLKMAHQFCTNCLPSEVLKLIVFNMQLHAGKLIKSARVSGLLQLLVTICRSANYIGYYVDISPLDTR